MDAVEDIKSRLSIEDVIADYGELKRSGRNFKALSPFTKEKTPSLMISPEKQIWHDFSSGKGGNMFSFVMEMEGVDFKGALELLARKAGVELSDYQSSQAGSSARLKERLYKVLDAAANYYQRQLTQHEAALTYVRKKRGYDKQTMLTFRLGYAPSSGSALHSYLSKQGYTDEELKKAGLVTQRYGKSSDMFRERIMVPLMDPQGRVIGFTARLLRDQPNAPKYINTPQTMLYDKGRHVFAFHLAKETIRQQKHCILVEGNLDVVAAHQAESCQVVATAGTALTEHHLKTVLHFTDDVRICFDQDAAGQSAIERSIGVASKLGVSLSVVPLPGGQDPDDVIRNDPAQWQALIQKPVYAIDWLLDRYAAQLDITSAQGKREYTDIVLGRLADIHDPVEQEHYIGVLSKRIDASVDALQAKLKQIISPPKAPKKQQKSNTGDVTAIEKHAQVRAKQRNHLLALALFQPALRKTIMSIPEEVIEDESAQALYKILKDNVDKGGTPLGDSSLREVEEYVKILQLQFEELYKDLDLIELRDEAKRIRIRLIEQYVTHKKHDIMTQLQTADEATEATLLAQVNHLNSLLKH